MAITLEQALEDRIVPFHWLLDIRSPTGTVLARYASSDVEADGKLWVGILTMRSLPRLSVDPRRGSSEVCSCRVELAPVGGEYFVPTTASYVDSLRACDLEVVFAYPFSSMKARGSKIILEVCAISCAARPASTSMRPSGVSKAPLSWIAMPLKRFLWLKPMRMTVLTGFPEAALYAYAAISPENL